MPYWQEVAPVVESARSLHGVDVTVLRLLEAQALASQHGGPVTYLAEVAEVAEQPELKLRPWHGELHDDPLRQTWARPGGPAGDVTWALTSLANAGQVLAGSPTQERTWNLSSLWRLPLAQGAAWLKVVPPFFAHEGAMLAALDPAAVPPLIAADGTRVLLTEVPGGDLYDAPGADLVPMVDLLVSLQLQWLGRTDELLALGLPDWRPEAFVPLAADVVDRTADQLDTTVVSRLRALVDDLPRRFADIESCGVPATLVHGDFHPGNVCADRGTLKLLDWGDCGVGHPLLDQAAFLAHRSDADRVLLRTRWAVLWRTAVPGCEPERAATLLEPVAALRQAMIYRMFLDNIEASERVYHAPDPASWLLRAASL